MTVRVTTLKGTGAGDYYVEQLPNYYLQSGEPRGIWFGDGATTLALTGDVDDEAFVALMAGMDPTRPDRHLGRSYDDKSVRDTYETSVEELEVEAINESGPLPSLDEFGGCPSGC